MERFTYVSGYGKSIVIDYNGPNILLGYEGLSSAEIIPRVTKGQKQIGNTLQDTSMGVRIITITYAVEACATSKGGYQEVYIFTRQSADGNWISGNTAQALVMSHQSGASVAVDAYVGLNVAALYGAHYICIGVRWKQQNEPTVLWIQDINREAP